VVGEDAKPNLPTPLSRSPQPGRPSLWTGRIATLQKGWSWKRAAVFFVADLEGRRSVKQLLSRQLPRAAQGPASSLDAALAAWRRIQAPTPRLSSAPQNWCGAARAAACLAPRLERQPPSPRAAGAWLRARVTARTRATRWRAIGPEPLAPAICQASARPPTTGGGLGCCWRDLLGHYRDSRYAHCAAGIRYAWCG